MIWHLDHVVWAIALTLATTPTPTPEPVTVPVVVTSSMTEAAPQPVTDPAPVVNPDVEATIALHTKVLRDLHVAIEATALGLSIHGDTGLAAEWAQQDLESARHWQAEWAATGIVHEGITAEYVELVAAFEGMVARWVPVTVDQSGVDDYKPVGANE